MESDNRFEKNVNVSVNNSTPEKPRKKSNRDAFYEVLWPLISSTLGLRPLHMWDVGRRAQIQEGQKVLELCAGYPLWKIYSGRVGNTGTFIALDINETISKRSRKITKLFNLGKKKQTEPIITADTYSLPFLNDSVDIVIISGLDKPSTAEDIFKETFRVLKPEGRLISSELGCPYPDTDILRRVGFTNIRQKVGTPFPLFMSLNRFVMASKPSSKDA